MEKNKECIGRSLFSIDLKVKKKIKILIKYYEKKILTYESVDLQ